jgi:hypothetical protein
MLMRCRTGKAGMQVDERIRGHLVDVIPARDDEASRMRQAWERAQAAKAKSQAGGSAGRGAGGWDGKPSEGHPEFLDGKGKLFDSKSKTWKSINQSVPARAPPAGAEYVNKTFPESGNRWERGFCSTPFCVSFASVRLRTLGKCTKYYLRIRVSVASIIRL